MIRDRSNETFQVILIGLVSVVFAVVVIYLATRNQVTAPPPEARQTAQPQAMQSLQAFMRPSLPAPSYQPPRPQPSAVPTGPTTEQLRRYNALQENCYRVSRMNSTGEYPALQTSACNDYARYASSVGVSAGELPTVLVAKVAAPQSGYAQSANRVITPPAECLSLEQAKQQINAATRQSQSASAMDYYRQEIHRIDTRMWDLNCRNH